MGEEVRKKARAAEGQLKFGTDSNKLIVTKPQKVPGLFFKPEYKQFSPRQC